MRVTILFIIPVLMLAECKGAKKHRLQSEKGLKVRFEIKNFQDKLGDCDKQDGDCAQIDMVYPLVTEGAPKVQQAINDSIYSFLIQNLVFESFSGVPSEQSLKSATRSFLAEWQAALASAPDSDASNGWEVSVTGEVGLHTPKVASITLGSYSYAGGAHPNSFVSVMNFDLNTGKTLIWQDFITDMSALEKMAALEFRKARELPVNTDLVDEGFFWGESFELPQNFELQQEGIYFWYNPFEVAAYSVGPTEFTISYKDLGKLVKKEMIF